MAKKITIHTEVDVFDSLTELVAKEQKLLELAGQMADQAYAPYSHFHVGAALELENGEVISGNNQENAAYPSGMCAERVAVFYAGAQYPGIPIKTLAIRAKSKVGPIDGPVAPCGSCRQAIAEYERNFGQPITLLLMGDDEQVYRVGSLADLLPFGFTPEELKR